MAVCCLLSAVRPAQSGDCRIKSLTASKVCPSSQIGADQSLHIVMVHSLAVAAFTKKKKSDMSLKYKFSLLEMKV